MFKPRPHQNGGRFLCNCKYAEMKTNPKQQPVQTSLKCAHVNAVHVIIHVPYTLCLKKTTVTLYTITSMHQPILVIFGRDIAERICY